MSQDSTDLLPLLDLGALLWFVTCWVGYVVYTKRRNLHKQHGLLAAMNRNRAQWAAAILERDNRIVDSQVSDSAGGRFRRRGIGGNEVAGRRDRPGEDDADVLAAENGT